MSQPERRRHFLKAGSIAAAAGLVGNWMRSDAAAQAPARTSHPPVRDEYDGFSRFKPSRGNDPDSDYYLGKMIPGFRSTADGPAPLEAPDLERLPWKMVRGAKEFHLVPMAVEREFLPGYKMNVYGFNGSMPGPTIEVTQGDRVRIVVTNELPEQTTTHWHGFELPVQYDGSETLTQNPIEPGASFVYEFDVHEEGTYFYHSHVPMQEAFGSVGWFIVHPKKVFDPPVDRDFGLIFQNFFIDSNQNIADSWQMDWNWHTINGRSGPYTTPLVVKHGERVRVRIMDFSPMQHHPVHLHGHTFWVTGHEGARIPKSAWVPRNTELIGIAQATDFEFIANNPGDWMFHCHMVHHMMNHMTRQVGPRIRQDSSVDSYLANLASRPAVDAVRTDPGFATPGYPQEMKSMKMPEAMMKTIWNRREVQGMRATWPMSVMGLMTTLRVLPDDLYHRVMETDAEIPPGSIFEEIVNRFGNPADYQPAKMGGMPGMKM
ncbi:multicopper oxidase domain-containing protein [Allorhodopirellula heiligendammensis]|uniref:Copper resistance protein A n=1 Tax=Allorhodopirellula heiligendammensis TaxID=2714739 RepID=A0A5C6BTY5_9BACT|nr:copper oxidase [Allorhodopirellula heiligendammensis]TWU15137.1 Copper resistance protein A precursor [Allorhodopirellula heiligendammensis]